MENLDLIILTVIVSVLYIGFAVALFSVQIKQQHSKKK
ncbi:hypothetical protein ACVWYG_002281 [Pedobacter sp. UYEF25]